MKETLEKWIRAGVVAACVDPEARRALLSAGDGVKNLVLGGFDAREPVNDDRVFLLPIGEPGAVLVDLGFYLPDARFQFAGVEK